MPPTKNAQSRNLREKSVEKMQKEMYNTFKDPNLKNTLPVLSQLIESWYTELEDVKQFIKSTDGI